LAASIYAPTIWDSLQTFDYLATLCRCFHPSLAPRCNRGDSFTDTKRFLIHCKASCSTAQEQMFFLIDLLSLAVFRNAKGILLSFWRRTPAVASRLRHNAAPPPPSATFIRDNPGCVHAFSGARQPTSAGRSCWRGDVHCPLGLSTSRPCKWRRSCHVLVRCDLDPPQLSSLSYSTIRSCVTGL